MLLKRLHPVAPSDGLRAQPPRRHLRLRRGLLRRDPGRNFELADPETCVASAAFHHWDDIDIFRGAEHVRSRGHGFAGVSRRGMLQILTARAAELGRRVRHHAELVDPESVRDADLVLVADGVSSGVRNRYAQHFGPQIDWRPNRFAWLGTTMPLDAFTFYFDEDAHGLWRVHAYQYEPGQSTFIVEATGDTWTRTGLPEADDAATVAFCERLFAHRLQGHQARRQPQPLAAFPQHSATTRWCWENIVLDRRRGPHGALLHRLGHQARHGGRHRALDGLRVQVQRGHPRGAGPVRAFAPGRRAQGAARGPDQPGVVRELAPLPEDSIRWSSPST
jgi:2-polyprenyl-6-methoxyphenol hydroxylase-like FAD-dependent oxidoreductase